jgi:hypothetical protein
VPHGIHLRAGPDLGVRAGELAEAVGDRVGLAGALTDLDRRGRVVPVPAAAARWGFGWDGEDDRTSSWWPQGITTSADRTGGDQGHRLVLVSWYRKDRAGTNQGSRLSVVDLDGPSGPRYRHVFLVEAAAGSGGAAEARPLRLHAGGIVWHRDHLFVAGTTRGVAVARLDDIVRVPAPGGRGARYLLPVRFEYAGGARSGHVPMRYSFLSLEHAEQHHPVALVAGEYARRGGAARLVRYRIDPASGLLALDAAREAHPVSLARAGIARMQGAAVAGGRWYVSTSAGPWLRGSLHVGAPGAFRRRCGVLPVGVEDLSYWPAREELWSLAEYPGRRCVFAMDRAALG